MNGRERRHVGNLLYRVTNEIIEEARAHGCGVIAVENLASIREDIDEADWFHRWAFRRLRKILAYKTTAIGIELATVEPRNTSIGCLECGHAERATRTEPNRTGSRFQCRRCDMIANADYNAARNVAFRYVRRGPQSPRGTGVSHCALVSGTVTPSGDYTPHLNP